MGLNDYPFLDELLSHPKPLRSTQSYLVIYLDRFHRDPCIKKSKEDDRHQIINRNILINAITLLWFYGPLCSNLDRRKDWGKLGILRGVWMRFLLGNYDLLPKTA